MTVYLKRAFLFEIFVGVLCFRVSRDCTTHVNSILAANRYVTAHYIRSHVHVIRIHKFAWEIHGVVTILLAYIFG